MVKEMNACGDKRKAGGEEDPNNNCQLNSERVQDLKISGSSRTYKKRSRSRSINLKDVEGISNLKLNDD